MPPTEDELNNLQAQARLVRLDAEGNPVDGTVQHMKVKDFVFFNDKPETVEERLQTYLTQKTVTMEFELQEVDEEFRRLLFGEDYDRVSDSADDRRWYHVWREAVRGLLAKVKSLFRG